MENNYSVYIHINKINAKKYVGITSVDPEQRWRNGRGYIHNKYFTFSIKKYGWDGFEHIILFTNLSEQEAKSKEIELINVYKSNDRNFGYNMSAGGEGSNGCKHTDEEKLKMSKNRKGKYKGKDHYLFGKHRSEEVKNKISKANSGENNFWFGKKHTKEEINKISESKTGSKNPNFNKFGKNNPTSKAVICIDTGIVYDSVTIASNSLDINKGNISSCCNGTIRIAGKLSDGTKLHWMRYEDYQKLQIKTA